MTIFIDRDKLSPRYIPEKLPHREKQIQFTISLFSDLMRGYPCKFTRIIQFIGPTGMGKTCSAYHVMRTLESKLKGIGIPIKPLYSNLKLEATTKATFYRSLAVKIDPSIASRSLSPSEQLKQIVDYITKKGINLLLVIDEVDEFLKRSSDVDLVYDLTRLSEFNLGGVTNIAGIIFIARDYDWRKYLSSAERSTLGNLVVRFDPYTKRQVRDILEYRVSEAFRKGAIDDEVIDFVSEVTVNYANSDIRYALDLLLYSGILAENEGARRVTLDHVRTVLSMFENIVTPQDITELNIKQKIVLLSVARALKMSNKQYVTLEEVRNSYKMICEEYNLKPMSNAEFEETLQELYDKGLIDVKGVNRIGIFRIPLDKLTVFLDQIIDELSLNFLS